MIFNREKDVIDIIKEQAESTADIKQSQILGRDNLVVTNYKEEVIQSISVLNGVYAEYTATFTFENPPSNAFVHMTFWYDVTITGGAGMYKTEYIPAAFVDSAFQRKYVFRFAPIGGDVTAIDLISYANTTEPGSLALVRTL